ncbi:G-protein coupled receptor GRL101-like isoform X1 [Rhopalosiphum maidis]|uniref:G-protein coupled receptor GRL101-like isoform X1 n=2 Tax=Rhopalosiphum maidis TaxID=43146 RepID=UPI000EFF824F|nr:G-protein coupled receptor GRL101-like isoform X1 [Rhopalosiphum maidis]
MSYFSFSLLILLLLIKFDVGDAQTDMKNNSTTAPTLCNQCLESDSCQSNSTLDIYHCDETYCIPKSLVCNGIPDCLRAEDEAVSECGCLQNEFRCMNKCIELVKRCDKIADCDEGEDEIDCKTHVCPTTHFKCANYFCIPTDKTCDFKDDCGDGSDELQCKHRECWHGEFKCKNSECIRPGYLCDGEVNCVDGSDEENCETSDFIKCGGSHLVHSTFWCDGWPECTDNHADELLCNITCSENKFQCPNGRCINDANVCDGHCDCLQSNDGNCADEMNCTAFYNKTDDVIVCTTGSTLSCWVPEGNPSRCIRQKYICDGQNDCFNGLSISDEFGCDKPNSHLNDEFFKCKDGRWLPLKHRCNFKAECLNGEDETNCEVSLPCDEDQFRCASGECVKSENRCDGHTDCWDKSDEIGCATVPCPSENWLRCEIGKQCVPMEKWCDYRVDCMDGSDEKNCDYRLCKADEFQCDSGQCIPLEYKCKKYREELMGCVDKSHLRNCVNSKCDENEFKCHRGPCIHQSMVCDGLLDCDLTWDDEDNNCYFMCSHIASDCQCQDVHINCTGHGLVQFPYDVEKEITFFHLGGNNFSEGLHENTFQHLDRLVYLDLMNNSIKHLEPFLFSTLWRLKTLNLQNNKITNLRNCSFMGLGQLTGLHLQGNNIYKLSSMAFQGLSSLITLDLSNQNITDIESEAFVGLRSLKSLDLSDNSLTHIRDGTFRGMPQVVFLNLKNNQLKVIDKNVFFTMPLLETLFTDEFRFCCLARYVKQCEPLPDEFSSCEDLMSNIVLRVCIWILAVVAITANLLVIVFRAKYKHTNQVHSFLIVNLALGDFLMGSYLLVIAVVDWYYRGVYFIHDSDWRRSSMCNVAGFISTFSSELSVFTLTVITLERLLAIIFPFKVRRLEMDFTRILMAVCWLLAIIISAIPLFNIHYFRNFYGRSGVCLALHITPDKPNGWEYSVFIFLFVNLGSLLLISGSYLWMFFVAKMTHRATETLIRHRSLSESAMAWRMSLLVATDAACWVPIIGLGLWSLAGFTVHPQVFAWVAVFVLPLNAAVNPVLYTLSAVPIIRRTVVSNRRAVSFRRSVTNDPNRTMSTTMVPPSVQYNGDKVTFSLITKIPHRGPEIVETEMTTNGRSITFGKMI